MAKTPLRTGNAPVTFVVLLLLAFAGSLASPASTASDPSILPVEGAAFEASFAFPQGHYDSSALMTEFRATAAMRLDVPLLGTLTLIGVEDDPYGGTYQGEWYYSNGTWSCCKVRSYLSFDGSALGYAESEVHAYISDNGLYIDIELPRVISTTLPQGAYLIQFDVAEPEPSQLFQAVTIHRTGEAASESNAQNIEPNPCLQLTTTRSNELVACLAAWAQEEIGDLECPSIQTQRTGETWILDCILSYVPPVDEFECPSIFSRTVASEIVACLLTYLPPVDQCPALIGGGSLVECLEGLVLGLDVSCISDGTPGTGDFCTLYWQGQGVAFLVVGLVAGVALLPLAVTCEEDGLVLPETDSTGSGAACATVFSAQTCAPQPPSYVVMHAELSFANRFQDTFAERIVSAFDGYDQMWHDRCIPLEMLGAATITENGGVPSNILTNNNCDGDNPVNHQYSEYLKARPEVTGAESYQLWTHKDLDGLSCYAVGVADQAHQGSNNKNAVSVVEGVDVNSPCCDKYDPDEKRQRGLVSGHEMGHVYGEEDHPADFCQGPDKYNMMNDLWDVYVREKGFCFRSNSKLELTYRYFNGGEP